MAKTKACCVNGCKNKNIGADSGVIFYKFPEENALRKRWVEACLKNNAISDADQNWTPSNDTVICNVHFVSGKSSSFKLYLCLIYCSISKWQLV